ncbi:enoyl-CoA delta isomerase 1, mitochondrial-like isoform X1 [Mytilus californianus]|uniref:enoyl-CoA delta isomerase 1, mitochondrial-like isoform X1 n=2 Tax=Mytilus californianus TaxID=6549 RepID=UPI0022471EE3|nr:enoyl-CoA delta isomerase 1, mitochondrial-like isoform X1 [Mytilus californianus]
MASSILRRFIPRKTTWQYGQRLMSSTLDVSVDEQTGIALLKMKRKPVNSLNLEFLQDIRSTIVTLEQNKKCKGLVLTSDVPKIFSAGIDILEMYQPNEERLHSFWRALQDMWLQLYVTPLATIAAINGHSPAGGCLISISCDYRIMAPNYTIGLNETLLGIVAPFWFKDAMCNTVGHREAEIALALGKLYSTDEALQKGLVDEVVPSEQIMEAAQKKLLEYVKIPNMARALSKQLMRQETADKLRSKQDSDIQNFVNFCLQDKVQQSLGFYLEQLKKRKSK